MVCGCKAPDSGRADFRVVDRFESGRPSTRLDPATLFDETPLTVWDATTPEFSRDWETRNLAPAPDLETPGPNGKGTARRVILHARHAFDGSETDLIEVRASGLANGHLLLNWANRR